MNLKVINEEDFLKFANSNPLNSFYESLEWYHLKQKEGKKCELVGLFKGKKLVGVSIIIYIKILRKFYMAYSSRGFLYDYKKNAEFTDALKKYFNNNVVFFRMDPPIVMVSYDKDMQKCEFEESISLINDLKRNGFKHYGFNTDFKTMQFRFVNKLSIEESFEKQLLNMNKSTKKNIELAISKGVRIKRVDYQDFDKVYNLFENTIERKNIDGFSKEFYESLINEFKDNIVMYLTYIDKKEYISNLEKKLDDAKNSIFEINKKMEHDNVGAKLKKQLEDAKKTKEKILQELKEAEALEDRTYIASMLSIFMYDEAVSFVSGMDNKYRAFCPKYAMYPELIKEAKSKQKKYVNFLGVKNIFDKNDSAYGVFEVKRGFGGHTLEYIGEFDLPFNKILYIIYKIKENKERGKL